MHIIHAVYKDPSVDIITVLYIATHMVCTVLISCTLYRKYIKYVTFKNSQKHR